MANLLVKFINLIMSFSVVSVLVTYQSTIGDLRKKRTYLKALSLSELLIATYSLIFTSTLRYRKIKKLLPK